MGWRWIAAGSCARRSLWSWPTSTRRATRASWCGGCGAAEVLYALGDPLSFVLLLGSFLVAVTTSGWLAAVAADRTGDRRPRAEGRLRPDPRRHVDPFGAIAGALAGFGWARPLEPLGIRRRRGPLLASCLAGPIGNLVLAAAALVGYRVVSGHAPLVGAVLL